MPLSHCAQAIRECIQEVGPAGARYQVFGAPGSETVWKEDDDTLAPCNAETCPGADVLEALEVSAAAPIAVAAGTAAAQDLPTDAAGTARQALVNRSPWLTAVSLVGVINSRCAHVRLLGEFGGYVVDAAKQQPGACRPLRT